MHQFDVVITNICNHFYKTFEYLVLLALFHSERVLLPFSWQAQEIMKLASAHSSSIKRTSTSSSNKIKKISKWLPSKPAFSASKRFMCYIFIIQASIMILGSLTKRTTCTTINTRDKRQRIFLGETIKEKTLQLPQR